MQILTIIGHRVSALHVVTSKLRMMIYYLYRLLIFVVRNRSDKNLYIRPLHAATVTLVENFCAKNEFALRYSIVLKGFEFSRQNISKFCNSDVCRFTEKN